MDIENTIEFLDWLVSLNISFYKNTPSFGYETTGNSHFYLSGSQERFTSKEMLDLWNNTATEEVNKNWQYAIAENIEFVKKNH
jgi:hypothetical protein